MKEFAVIPFNSDVISDKYLVSNMLGAWDMLDRDDFNLLSSFKCDKGTRYLTGCMKKEFWLTNPMSTSLSMITGI
jgi:hypothetical protein